MATFTETLTQIVPTLQTAGAAEIRSSLIGLASQLQEDHDSQAHSLQSWWQWLDDEGYDRETFATGLAQICKVRIGEQGLLDLTAFIQSSKDKSDGITLLLDQINQNNPAFVEEIETLESLALEEEKQLGAIAGGMGKGGKWGTGAAGVVVAVGITGLIIWKTKQNRKIALEKELQIMTERNLQHKLQHEEDIITNLNLPDISKRRQETVDIKDFTPDQINEKARLYATADAKHFKLEFEIAIRNDMEKLYRNNEQQYMADLIKHDEENTKFLLKNTYRLNLPTEEILEKYGDFPLALEVKKNFELSGFEPALDKWIKNNSDLEQGLKKAYLEATTNAYKDLLTVEKEYKNNDELFKIAKDFDPTGFAGGVVNKGINEAKAFMTDIMFDVKEQAKAAKIELDQASKSFVQKQKALIDDDARERVESAETKLERTIEDGETVETRV